MNIYINPTGASMVLKKYDNKECFIIYNNLFYKSIPFIKNISFISKEAGVLRLKTECVIPFNRQLIEKTINSYIFLWDFFLFSKLTYKGKSFKLKKKKNFVNFILNTSHITMALSNLNLVKRLRKAKLLYIYNNSKLFNIYIYKILSYRYLNIFTKRGLRLERMRIFKKKGKTNMKI